MLRYKVEFCGIMYRKFNLNGVVAMKDMFINVSSACPLTRVGDVEFNIKNIIKCIDIAQEKNAKLIVFPELSVTSYTCSDLFLHGHLYEKALDGIKNVCEYSKEKDILIAIGAPLLYCDALYNCAYIIYNGKILGIVPKSYIPNYSEFYEARWFKSGLSIVDKYVDVLGFNNIPFGMDIIFTSENIKFGFEICEDLWAVIPPSSFLSLSGANIIGNLSASNDLVSKADYRRALVEGQSAKAICGYVYASAGVYESTTDLVFGGHMLISEYGSTFKENERFKRDNEVITSIIDVEKLRAERLRNTSFGNSAANADLKYRYINFKYKSLEINDFDRYINRHPFIPQNPETMEKRCQEIFNIQSAGLAKRIEHTELKKAVIGMSGGLDSTLALLVIIKTFDLLKISRKNIITVTMPGFGTTDRTYKNAVKLCNNLSTDLREINIVDACLQHFKDIRHPVENHDTTYENVQARERTQILMDIANKEGGLVVGTGDLSELALGWCTYNGDHMSMYAVNSSVPKTLVRYLVVYAAEYEMDKATAEVLYDILDTPVSPELLPSDKDGNIVQKTEDIVGPYELHDFFLYYFIRQCASPEKILFLAKHAFRDIYTEEIIEKWFSRFIKRFFTQQFKRSSIPDGPKVGTVSLSPRGDWRMPSDASMSLWLNNNN